MPLYELLCLSKPALPRAELVAMMQRVSLVIMQRGGVLTNLLSYGEQHLAYDLRRPFERYSKVLTDINHELRVNTNVLRWINVKRKTKDVFNSAPSQAVGKGVRVDEISGAWQSSTQAEQLSEPAPTAASQQAGSRSSTVDS